MATATEKTQTITTKQPATTIRKGPMEGIIIVNGRPQTERADLPTISFESIQALMKFSRNNK